MQYDKEEIIRLIKKSFEVMVAVDGKGTIRECIPFIHSTSKLSLEEFDKIIGKETKKGYAVGFILQDVKMNKTKLEQKIKDLVEALEYSKTHKLKPGVNIPENKKYYSLKKRLAKKLRLKE